MMKITTVISKKTVLALAVAAGFWTQAAETAKPDGADRADWFRDAQYGLFVHWGCYSVPAKGEWYLNQSQMDPQDYRRFAEAFKADKYDARAWAKMAKRWGMRYAVFTTRHHDGYAMWDSKVNPWNCMNVGPRRDILKAFVEAFRAEGLKVGYYYSPANWSDPDYAGYGVRGWPRGANPWKGEEERKRFVAYYKAEFAELMGKYGEPDLVWWDGCIPRGLEGDVLLKDLRKAHPNLVWNNRMGSPYDFRCCEQEIAQPRNWAGPWEACMTLNRNWGYAADDHDWKSPADVLDMLLECQSGGGNLLLNVGPKPDGTIPAESVAILDCAGKTLARPAVMDALRVYDKAVANRGDAKMLRRVFEKAERGGEIRIAVMGGSITEGARAASKEGQWGSVFADGWRELFPKAKVTFRNVGVGATGSVIGAFRYSRDVSPFKPDLVAFEFSVNDPETDESRLSMEGLVRHAVREGAAVMLLGMVNQAGRSAQAQHLAAVRAYGAPFVSYRDAVMSMIGKGKWKWEDVAADGVHPNPHGHALAGELMNLFVRESWMRFRRERQAVVKVPDPVVTKPFEKGSFTPFGELKDAACEGFRPYAEPRWGTGLEATNAGARVTFSFEGTNAAFLYRKGDQPLGKVKVIVDGEELKERPDGFEKKWWWHTPAFWICRGKQGKHVVTVETTGEKNPDSKGCGFRLSVLMVEP